jgi:hypothetical protein
VQWCVDPQQVHGDQVENTCRAVIAAIQRQAALHCSPLHCTALHCPGLHDLPCVPVSALALGLQPSR